MSFLEKEINDTIKIIENISTKNILDAKTIIKSKVFITWEGSSRIFPWTYLQYLSRVYSYNQEIIVDGALQVNEYNLDNSTVIIWSNSWKTKECVLLADNLKKKSTTNSLLVSAHQGSLLSTMVDYCHILTCWSEKAVAATKSVIEQALFYDILFRELNWLPGLDLMYLANEIQKIMDSVVDNRVLDIIISSQSVYRSGPNNWVAEELVLKTNEIIRKKSQYLEWTYIVHGIEEVMNNNECVILQNMWASEVSKVIENIHHWAWVPIIIITHTDYSNTENIPTIQIDNTIPLDYLPYVYMAIWRKILLEAWKKLNINLDKPQRARKVGNEFIG